jgi:hypothetical protein
MSEEEERNLEEQAPASAAVGGKKKLQGTNQRLNALQQT